MDEKACWFQGREWGGRGRGGARGNACAADGIRYGLRNMNARGKRGQESTMLPMGNIVICACGTTLYGH